ncbi:DUF418 domain-containing protein [Phytomonospora endophytica]|uniref:Putative membrane protein YeiB n=1 Tax=Phytomonospora endophytica TaxID=714109 RepID=A0A841FQJ1_9ACTN|nr:DUF418 domain-containing protein [Phytomonospora endophytica]MBB6036068.1 putative membrane protein YeiB [Phytomonospora endophytica]GIG66973.1 hypothetical protein Pen01_32680 [Phytomonospora endophytica]
MTTVTAPARGPVQRAERALAPDLARGAMLLLIALANVAGVVFAGEPGFDPAPEGADRGLTFLLFELVHARGYPVFAVMFGYGLVQLARRQDASGATPAQVRAVLLRRNLWLVVFGLVHATLLYYGDFLGAYGIVGVVMTLVLLRRGDRFHRIALALWAFSAVEVLVLGVIAYTSMSGDGTAAMPSSPIASLTADGYVASMLDRLAEWPTHTLTVLPFIMIAWLGMWAARRRVLEEPARHKGLLKWTAVAGLGIAVLGGFPAAMLSAGWLHVDEGAASLMLMLHGASGMFAGPGYIALIGLIAMRVMRSGRTGPVVASLSALGKRSLSGYLTQSVAWLVLLLPFTLGLGDAFGSPTVTGLVIAVAVWAATVLGARALERRGHAGPAERLLRRLTYGRRG